MSIIYSKHHDKENSVIETQIFENPNFQNRDRKSRSKSRHHQIEASEFVTNLPEDNKPFAHPTSDWHHQLDMMSLSKHQNIEIPFDRKNPRETKEQKELGNPFQNPSKSSHMVNDVPTVPNSPYNPFSASNDNQNTGSDQSFLPFFTSSPNVAKKPSMWATELPIMEHGSQPSTIELLPETTENDDYSSSESIDTNSFSSYIPGPTLDHGTFAAFTDLVDQEQANDRTKMIPLMKQTSSQGLVLASKQSPKIRYEK